MERIDQPDDPRLDPYRDLKGASRTRWNRPLIAEGYRVVRRAVALDWPFESLLVSARRRGSDEIEPMLAELTRRGVPLYEVEQSLAESLAGFNFHAGVLAHLRRPRSMRFETWVEGLAADELIVGCPEMTDPENVGLVMRTAAAFGVRRMLVGTASADPLGRRALRLSMGAALKLRLLRTSRFTESLERLRHEQGVRVAAAVCDPAAEPPEAFARTGRRLLLLGNESRGLPDELERLADDRVSIPIASDIDSLNVTAAATILLYAWRQREESGQGRSV